MRMLALSDISWRTPALSTIPELVDKFRPALVVLAGDLVNDHDRAPSKGWQQVAELLAFLDQRCARTFIVRGNWDEPEPNAHFLRKAIEPLHNVFDLSDQMMTWEEVKFLGIPHSTTARLASARLLRQKYPEPVDFIIAHADYRRRIWLCQLAPRFILTGHFGKQFCKVRDLIDQHI